MQEPAGKPIVELSTKLKLHPVHTEGDEQAEH